MKRPSDAVPVLLHNGFWILHLQRIKRRTRASLQIDIEERAQIVRRDRKAAPPVKAAEHVNAAHQPKQNLTLQQNLIAEGEMVGAND